MADHEAKKIAAAAVLVAVIVKRKKARKEKSHLCYPVYLSIYFTDSCFEVALRSNFRANLNLGSIWKVRSLGLVGFL